MFFSCENNFEDVKLINKDSKIPVGVSDNFILKYSDSASLKAVLESPKNIDFTNQPFPYSEFPKGLKIEFFDPYSGSTTVKADYGIVYYKTRMVSLEGNVKIISPDSTSIESSQVYWDPDLEWHTHEPFVLRPGAAQGIFAFGIHKKMLEVNAGIQISKCGGQPFVLLPDTSDE